MLGDKHIFIALFFASTLCLIPFTSNSQTASKAQLRKEKKDKQKRLSEVEKILEQTSSKKKNTLGELQAINQKIKDQQSIINSIKAEMGFLDSEIDETSQIISSLEADLATLKKEYASMVYSAYKTSSGVTELTFLFSSTSFSELQGRIKYLEEYSKSRKKQIVQIEKVKATLELQLGVIEEKRNEKSDLLSEQLKESSTLARFKDQRKNVLNSLVSQESKLRADLESTKKALASLENKITAIINAEIAAAAASKKPASSLVSGSFEKNKAKFSWPVEGFISQKFGRQNHAALKGVIVENDGIGIQTKQNEVARAIFDGDVRVVIFVPTLGYSALIKHGEYFTVYAGLKAPLIKAGDKVQAGEQLGEVITKPEGVTELWFEIRKGRDPLNPEQWLAAR